MKIFFHKRFNKKAKLLPTNHKEKLKGRLRLFQKDQFHPTLNNHPLVGSKKGYRSINITGDIRAVYKFEGDTIIFVDVDTHSELYK